MSIDQLFGIMKQHNSYSKAILEDDQDGLALHILKNADRYECNLKFNGKTKHDLELAEAVAEQRIKLFNKWAKETAADKHRSEQDSLRLCKCAALRGYIKDVKIGKRKVIITDDYLGKFKFFIQDNENKDDFISALIYGMSNSIWFNMIYLTTKGRLKRAQEIFELAKSSN